MYPILFDAYGIVIPSWHLLYVLGAILALVILRSYNRIYPYAEDRQIDRLFFLAYVAGYFGARLFAVTVEQNGFKNGLPFVWLQLFEFGAMTFYGGFLAAFLSSFIYLKLQKSKPIAMYRAADAATVAGFTALVIGRIGCFLNGDDYGIPVAADQINTWWAVTFPNHATLVARYPVQLWEAGSVLLLLLALLSWKYYRSLRDGLVASFVIGGYGSIRFILEFYRGDFRGDSGFLSPAQWISLLLILGSNILVFKILTKYTQDKQT